MMKKHLLAIISLIMVLSLTLVGCGSTATPNSATTNNKNANFKVGLVTDVGGLNDHSFNALAYQGLQKAKQDLGVTTSVVESKQMTDYETNLSNFAQQKYNLVIAVGYLMHDAVVKVAKEYPNTKFMIIDSEITGMPNVSSALFKTELCGYLVGVMAGAMEKTSGIPHLNGKNTVGIVGGMAIPPVNDYIAGFIQGAKSVDPNINIQLKYTGAFTDPVGGKQMAQTMIANGADILFPVAGATGNGVIDAAKQAGIYAIGVDANQNYLAPNNVMTSAIKGVDVATYDSIKDTLNNQFKTGDVYYDLANNGVGYATPIAVVPQAVLAKVQAAANKIKDGTIKPSNVMPKGYGQ